MDQAIIGSIPQSTINQPTSAIGIAALAAHYRHLLHAVSDKDRDHGEVEAVGTMILNREPDSCDDLLSLAIAVHHELDTLAANSQGAIDFGEGHPDADQLAEADLFRRLAKASHAIVRGLIRHTGADSPMVCDWTDRVD